MEEDADESKRAEELMDMRSGLELTCIDNQDKTEARL